LLEKEVNFIIEKEKAQGRANTGDVTRLHPQR